MVESITVKKDQDFSEWYSQVIQKADLADIRFGIQGFIVHKPWGFMIIRKFYEYLEKELEEKNHVPYLFPVAVKEESLTMEKEHAGFTPEVFWVSEAGNKKIEERFALRPTGEAQIYPMYSLWFRSHNELPFKAYQSRHTVYRNEMTTRPFLRGREFLFFESHNVFNTHEEVKKQISEDLEICEKIIHEKIKIPFLYFKRPDWDKFKGADFTYTPDTIMPDGKRNQLASTHDLGQNFSRAYNIKVIGDDKKEHFVYQTCFGPGIWRIMAALIGIHGDDKGLILPFDISPIQIVIIPIFFKDKKEEIKIIKKVRDIEKKLGKLYKVKLDDSNESPGFKYNKWELKGIPLRIEVGPKELKENSVSLVIRTEYARKKVKISSLEKEIKNSSKKLDKQIKAKAENYFKENTKSTESYNELKNIIKNHRGFIKVPFCSTTNEGKSCAEKLKSDTEGGCVCGTLYPEEKSPANKKCIVCGKKANNFVYIAKSY